jgi:hypothetical protein
MAWWWALLGDGDGLVGTAWWGRLGGDGLVGTAWWGRLDGDDLVGTAWWWGRNYNILSLKSINMILALWDIFILKILSKCLKIFSFWKSCQNVLRYFRLKILSRFKWKEKLKKFFFFYHWRDSNLRLKLKLHYFITLLSSDEIYILQIYLHIYIYKVTCTIMWSVTWSRKFHFKYDLAMMFNTKLSCCFKIFLFEDRSEIVFKIKYLNLKCFSLTTSSFF